MSAVFLVSDELARLAKHRFYHWQEQGFPNLDGGMSDVLIKLNRIPGVTSLFCCCGHEAQDRFYIMCLVNGEQGAANISKLFAKWRHNLTLIETDDDSLPYFPELQISYAGSIFAQEGFPEDYPSWTFSSYYNSDEDAVHVRISMLAAIQELLGEIRNEIG